MSQELREQKSSETDITRTTMDNSNGENYEGFEGMNYEQIRPPYNPKHTDRNNGEEERKTNKRPDEN